jgi:hypothetical protein
MTRRRLAVGFLLGATVFASGAASGAVPYRATSVFEVRLDGYQVPGGNGDRDASGYATLWVDADNERVCYELAAWDVRRPSAAYLHVGPIGRQGPVVVPLAPPEAGDRYACSYVSWAQARDIERYPYAYNVTIYADDHPGGALRGQLGPTLDVAYVYLFDPSTYVYRYDHDVERYFYYDVRGDIAYVNVDVYNRGWSYSDVYYDVERNYYYYDDDDDHGDHDWDDDWDDRGGE